MASIFKRGRWIDAQGRKCTKDTPGAKWAESRFYTVQMFVDGKCKLVKGYTDKAASEQLGAKLERARAQGEQGLQDIYKAHRGQPLAKHIEDYVAELTTLGRDDKYIDVIKWRLAKLRKACGWKLLGDIDTDSFCHWREKPIAQGNADSEDGKIGPITLNQYLEAARTFCAWCVKRKRLAVNPLADVVKMDETEGDLRRARRALTADQVTALLAAVAEHQKLVYRFFLATGLRRQEVEDLRWGDVRLNATMPFLKLRAKATKSRRADTLPLREDVAADLRKLRGDAGDADRVFASIPTMEEHKAYLEAAGIPFEDSEGLRADIHALRHTFGTLLSKAGVSPRETMSLMRHTDMRLTMNVYTDPRIFDLAGAVAKLPYAAGGDQAGAAVATGTTGALPDESGRSKSVSSESAGTGISLAGIGGQDTPEDATQPLVIGGDRQEKTPIGDDRGKAPRVGFEHTPNTPYSPEKPHKSASGAVKASVAVFPPMPADAELQAVVEAWPTLPATVRQALAAMATAAALGRKQP